MTQEKTIKRYEKKPENLLLALHSLQENNVNHYLTKDDLMEVSKYFSLPYSFVYGVASFYSMYSFKPRGKYIVRVCKSPPCHLMGASSIIDELKKVLRINFGETTKDNLFTLEFSSCLGVCGVAPAMMINEEVFGNLTPQRIREIIEEKRREK
jgi:NADH:ubiquinone oxidoreductase subunit E